VIYRISHTTTYQYTDPVALGHHLVHLTCRVTPRQTTRQSQVLIDPIPSVSTARIDAFGNPMQFFALQEPHLKLTIAATNVTDLRGSGPAASDTPAWEDVVARLASERSPEALDALQFTFPSPYVPNLPDLVEYARPSFGASRPLFPALLDLMGRIHADFRYDTTATTLTTPVGEVLHGRRGVCQDFAHLMIGCLRGLGLPARYVSGYLRTTPPRGQPRLVGADASHAWVAVWCPGVGWIDLDPTNNTVPGDKHVTLAWGRDYDDVSPIKGILLGGGPHTVAVAVDVVPV
jgi:transglutaminase-like putative cysteine protease